LVSSIIHRGAQSRSLVQSEHVHTVEDALMHLTHPETVQVHSGVRGGLVDASKQVLIESLPPILVVHVKRFLYDLHGGVQKSSKPLLYKTTLELPRGIPYLSNVQAITDVVSMQTYCRSTKEASRHRGTNYTQVRAGYRICETSS
jgi:hypothetical protein